jgi:hypothetical protein
MADFVIVNSQYPKITGEFYKDVLPGYERDSIHYIAQFDIVNHSLQIHRNIFLSFLEQTLQPL